MCFLAADGNKGRGGATRGSAGDDLTEDRLKSTDVLGVNVIKHLLLQPPSIGKLSETPTDVGGRSEVTTGPAWTGFPPCRCRVCFHHWNKYPPELVCSSFIGELL